MSIAKNIKICLQIQGQPPLLQAIEFVLTDSSQSRFDDELAFGAHYD
jgi:hypothetical protein